MFKFLVNSSTNGLKSITIEYIGEIGKLNTKPLTAVCLKGVLAPMVSSVNAVNARNVAQERGIEVIETTKEQSGNYQSLIRVTIQTEKRERAVAGTLFAGYPRIVEVAGVKLEANLGQNIIYVNNEDKPGLIGNLGKVLGEAGINVANFHLGRGKDSGDAVALVEVDEAVKDDVIVKIAALPTVKQVKFLRF